MPNGIGGEQAAQPQSSASDLQIRLSQLIARQGELEGKRAGGTLSPFEGSELTATRQQIAQTQALLEKAREDEARKIIGEAETPESIRGREQEATARELAQLEQALRLEEQLAGESIQRQAAPLFARQAEEAAVTGTLRSPVFQQRRGRLEQEQIGRLSDVIRGIRGQSFRARAGAERRLSESLRNAPRESFRQRLGLQSAITGARTGVRGLSGELFGRAERGTERSLESILGGRELEESARLGRLQAEAAEPGAFEKATSLIGALGGLAGGIGATGAGPAIGRGLVKVGRGIRRKFGKK